MTIKMAMKKCWCVALAVWVPFSGWAGPPPVPAVIQRNYEAARRFYQDHPADDQADWQLGRACFDRAEFARDDAERARLAEEGIDACRKVTARRPALAAGHYYLGMNLAQLARTKLLGALPIVNQMESEWKTALALDEKIDYAGPDRLLGLLYRDAPRWPISVGDAGKAHQCLARAVEACPNYPDNYLNLIESDLTWNEPAAAARALKQLRQILPAARKEFTGEYWEPAWKDWNERLEKIQAKLAVPDPAPPR